MPTWLKMLLHVGLPLAGFVALTVFQWYDLFVLGHPFSSSGYGMALGAIVGGSGIGAGVLALGALGSGGGRITEG